MKKFNISNEYDIELFDGSVYDSKTETLAQICAFLNPLRQKAAEKLGVKSEMKLSPGYVLYYYFYNIADDLLSLCEKDKNEKKLLSLLDVYFSKLFTFDDFKRIVSAHGLAVISAMPDAAHHHKSDALYVLENRLRLGIRQIISGTESKEKILSDAAEILADGLGAPPDKFDFTFINLNGELETLEGVTPLSFFSNYCKTNLNDYVLCEPSKDAVLRMLEENEQVVVCADTRHQNNQMLGILDTDFTDNTDMFGADYSLTKDEKLELKIIKPTAYLSIDGIAFDENKKPIRFKAQDSHGSETGANGHYMMSADWFDSYVLSAVVNKKYL